MTDRKKKNPQDATMRNVKAAKKRTDSLEERVELLEELVASLCEGFLQLSNVIIKERSDYRRNAP